MTTQDYAKRMQELELSREAVHLRIAEIDATIGDLEARKLKLGVELAEKNFEMTKLTIQAQNDGERS